MSADWERTNRSEGGEGGPVIEYNGVEFGIATDRGGVVDDMEMSMVNLN